MHQMECARPHRSYDCNCIEGQYRKLRVSSDYGFVQSFRVAEICWYLWYLLQNVHNNHCEYAWFAKASSRVRPRRPASPNSTDYSDIIANIDIQMINVVVLYGFTEIYYRFS